MSDQAAEIEYLEEETGIIRTASGKMGDSLLDVALGNRIYLEHTCGGSCACSTCHVHVIEGEAYLSEAGDTELDQLELAPGFRPDSRLACQAIIIKPGKIRCVIPRWNRNAVREGR